MTKDDSADKQWCKNQVEALVEVLDDCIPFVGKFMDIPIIDKVETQIVDKTVDFIWDVVHDTDTSLKNIDTFMIWSS